MNELIESEQENAYPITVYITLSNGNAYNQPLEIDSDGAQSFMDWFRDPKGGPVWSWNTPTEKKIVMFHRTHIASVDVSGYLEPDGRESRWYERLLDKIHTKLYFVWRKMGNRFVKGGEDIGKSQNELRKEEQTI